MPQLYHVSDSAGIDRFDPRPASNNSSVVGDAVWAVDEEHLPNYLFPRDCPRVCFARNSTTTIEDESQFLQYSNDGRIIAVEWEWQRRICSSVLYIYELPSDSFNLIDANAGYFISRDPVAPLSVSIVDDLLAEMQQRRIELRFTADLWKLHDAVAKSSLEFSMIRMRNAKSEG
ncbi:MAG TPA: hypothetical protein VG537_03905 [Candidatus Kapabacteria bacterium]|jgi:hypothetical protein|nr:hypothetical protein [Candidatus Kapabacteria bacterium]